MVVRLAKSRRRIDASSPSSKAIKHMKMPAASD
jgi:hypothetical protein